MTAEIDFDIHGLSGIRLVDASEGEVRAVRRQLGIAPSLLVREPDITIRFVDRLPTSRLRLLGLDDAGFTEDAFLVLRSRHKSRARVRIPFETVGERPEIVCERGLSAVPLLIPIVNLGILSRGALPLHAAAFNYAGTGYLATGWSKGGKTETLLAFMDRGASYIGDEWVYLNGDGSRMCGIPEPIRVWDWHLRSLPRYRDAIRLRERLRLKILGLLGDGLETVLSPGANSRSSLSSLLGRVGALVAKQRHVDVPPASLFGAAACPLSGTCDRVLFVTSHDSPSVEVEPIDGAEVARRMVFSLQEELAPFLSYYRKFRFAFPGLSNDRVDDCRRLQGELLERFLSDKMAYEVLHPYPMSLPKLFEAISEQCGGA